MGMGDYLEDDGIPIDTFECDILHSNTVQSHKNPKNTWVKLNAWGHTLPLKGDSHLGFMGCTMVFTKSCT